MYLLVYEVNIVVIGFYEVLGGVLVSWDWLEMVDGGYVWVCIYYWFEVEFLGLMGLC